MTSWRLKCCLQRKSSLIKATVTTRTLRRSRVGRRTEAGDCANHPSWMQKHGNNRGNSAILSPSLVPRWGAAESLSMLRGKPLKHQGVMCIRGPTRPSPLDSVYSEGADAPQSERGSQHDRRFRWRGGEVRYSSWVQNPKS